MTSNSRLSYRDFSNDDIDSLIYHDVLNGIGPQDIPWLFWLIQKLQPKWLTNASGYQHDAYYIFGGNEIDRYKADLEFYLIMLQDARQCSPNYLFYFLRRMRAYVYYRAVRIGGYKRFYYGPYRTKKDVMDMRYSK